MSEKKRNLLFSILAVIVSGAVFFSIGISSAGHMGLLPDDIGVLTPMDTTTASDASFLGTMDLNSATVADLMQIEGIGEKTAQKIIDYRDSIGGFLYVEQLQYVDGIGDVKYASWSPYFTVNGVGVGGATVATGVSNATTTQSTIHTGKYHLNRVTKEELMTISGVGEKIAQSIIRYREQIGGFTSLDQLMEIDGIGEKRFADLCKHLTLDSE